MARVQYVTAYYDVGSRSKETLFEDFRPFLQSKIHILLFTDHTDIPADVAQSSNLTVCFVPRENLSAFKFTDPVLPQNRNPEKDTLGFLELMNAKPEFLKRAMRFSKADGYVWFDLGILKISKNRERFIQRMERFAETFSTISNKIILPGCVSRDKIDFSNMFSFPIWRFCGGIILAPAGCVDEFVELHEKQLETCKTLNTLTWEVNLFANMEYEKPDFFHWFAADHNDSIVDAPLPEKEKKVILLTMIKNEHKIIRRLIESTLPIADAICVCDTGSTDNTVEVLTEYFKDFKIPTKLYNGPEHLWKNFGHNRSQSFLAGVDFCKELGWDAEHSYALVMDADMQLVVPPAFKKSMLTSVGYKMIQKSHSLEYYNTRLMKLSHPWKCVGVTHEYWDGANTDTISKDTLYISDIGDGGCKDDKFERDVRLLEQGLVDSPNNPRYLFYLAQSYKDNKQLDKAIDNYKKRINAGGWHEEIWYSMYMLMKLYAEKKEYAEMEMWGLKAYEFRKERSENILYLCRFFRDRRQHYKAWHYYELGAGIKKPDDLLFIETDVYERGFDYERAILHDYVFPHKKTLSLEHSLNFYNKWHDYAMYTNLQWFVQKIPSTVRQLCFQDIGDYVATSTSMARQPDGNVRLNVRYVNYRIQPNGSYQMMENGNLSGDHPVRTENYTCLMDANYNILSPLRNMEVTAPVLHSTHIKGLEDLRIFYGADGTLRYTGTTMEYSYNGKIRQVTGRYNTETCRLEDQKHLKPASETDCEKNWIPYKGDRMIYAWHPFQIGKPDEDGKLAIEVRQETPKFLSHMRGSSTLVRDGKYFYAITHCVMYLTPRKYYHMVVKIDAETDRLVGYTDPFFFLNNAIEYVLGFDKQNDTYTAILSQNDRNPVLVQFKSSDVVWRDM
jgi:glycosyltransferase involved in cell wall biosynthesis